MRVMWLAQEHSTMSPARARTRRARSGVERANHEATALATTQINRTLIGILRLFEIQDVMKKDSEFQEKDLVSYSQLPNCIVADITARPTTLLQLSLPTKALHSGFSLLAQSLVDFSFPVPPII